MAAEAKSPSPLLNLPAELRNEIYELVLVSRYKIWPVPRADMNKKLNTTFSTKDTIPLQALLYTNQHVRRDAQSIYYGENVFAFPKESEVLGWLTDLEPHCRRLLRRVLLTWKLPVSKDEVGAFVTVHAFSAQIESSVVHFHAVGHDGRWGAFVSADELVSPAWEFRGGWWRWTGQESEDT
jgi:hypothetical protein